jgi:isochorismate synthase
LWTSGEFCLAGHGVAHRIPITLANPSSVAGAVEALAKVSACGSRRTVAFAALPFDRAGLGELIVPQIVLEVDQGERSLSVVDGDMSTDEALAMIDSLESDAEEPDEFSVRSIHPPEYWRDEIVAKAIDLITAGRLDKVVLARELEITANRTFNASAVLDRLHKRYGTAIRFRVEDFLGASPELLVSRSNNVVSAHPLAGTSPRFEDLAQDVASSQELEASTKNQWEHRITINWLLDNLLPFCSYVDAEPEPQIVTLANVHHLGTRVEGRLSKPAAHVLELVAALHPTPAVGGAPQEEAVKLIGELEQANRDRYAGPVGWVDSDGNGAFAVAIRSAQIQGDTARLFAGVGVVGDSEPESELAETESKFQTMRQALAPDAG